MVWFGFIKSRARIEFILPCVVAIVLPLITYWQLLHFITFSQPGLPFWDYINSGPAVSQSPQAGSYPVNFYWIFWIVTSALNLNVLSINVLPKLMLGFISLLSSYIYFRFLILKSFPTMREKDTALVFGSLAGSIIYFFGISSFDAWAGITTVYSLLPLFGLLVLFGYAGSIKRRLFFMFSSAFIWVLGIALYPLAIITYLLPLLINFLVIFKDQKKKLMPFLYVSFIFIFMLILGYPVISSYFHSNVINPEVFSLPQLGRKGLLNSGNTISNLLVALPDPWLNLFVTNSHSILYSFELIIPILAFAYLLFLGRKGLNRTVGLALTAIAILTVCLYTISFPNSQGQPLLIVLGQHLPGPFSTVVVDLLGEFRVPEQILPVIFSILISFTVYSILHAASNYRITINFASKIRQIELKIISVILIFLAISAIGFSSYTLYTGYGGTSINGFSPVNDSDIAVTNYILDAHPSGSVIWVPSPPQFEFLLYGGDNLITYPFGNDGPSGTWYLDYVISTTNSLLTHCEIESAALFLSQIGVEYVAISSESSVTGSTLLNSSAFALAYRSGDSYLFYNNYYQKSWTSNNILYVAGGLNTYKQMIPYLNSVQYSYMNPVTFFLDREPLPNMQLTNGAYLFSQTSSIYDVAVPLMTNNSIIIPSHYASQTQGAQQGWTINSVTAIGLTDRAWNNWVNDDPLYEWQYTYRLNYGIAYTDSSAPSSLDIPVEMPEGGQYSILVRSYVSPDSKGLNFTIGGQTYNLNDKPTGVSGFVWSAVPVSLSPGSNNLVITSGGGLAAVNLIEIVKQSSLDEALQEANQLLSAAPQFYTLNLSQGIDSFLNFSLISPGNYSIYVQKQDVGFVTLTFKSSSVEPIAQWTENGIGLFEIGSADLQNQFTIEVHSTSVLNNTSILLHKLAQNSSQHNYTVLVDPVLFSFPYKTLSVAGFKLQAYPVYGMSTAFILPVDISSVGKVNIQPLQKWLLTCD